MATFQQTMNETKAMVFGGKCIAYGTADGGYEIRVQRAGNWNSRTPRIVVHVWHREAGAPKARLMKKAEWARLL